MHVPVVDPLSGKAFLLDDSDVFFIRLGSNRRDIFFVTKDNALRLVRSIQEMSAALDGTGFLRVDKNIIVNLERAKYDYEGYKLRFDRPVGIYRVESCHVSRENRAKVRKWFVTY